MSTKKISRPAVSVIIPMYNAADYIEQCLKSLLVQTLENFEIIVVDDCSTDDSADRAEKFVSKFGEKKKFSLIKTSSNTGSPSIPRNFGLEYSSGKYITFLDNDDSLTETALEELFALAEKFGADVVHTEKYFVPEKNFAAESWQRGEFVTKPTLETSEIGDRVSRFLERKFLWTPWGKFFRREFLLENKIKFPAVSAYEDFVFVFQCAASAEKYLRVPNVVYNWNMRGDSLSHRAPSSIKSTQNLVEAVNLLDNFMSSREFFIRRHEYRYAVTDFFVQTHLDAISENLFITSDFSPSEVYAFLCKEVFPRTPQENIPLTSYLFVAANIYKLLSNRQAQKINQLQAQLEERGGI